MTRVLLTGAGGFAGHHCLEHILATTDWDVVATDSFWHKGKTDRITQVLMEWPTWHRRVTVITHDLAAPFSPQTRSALGAVDYVICYASGSHVDRSISDPVPFVLNNTQIALNTLELCRELAPKAVTWISTDEVYGPQAKDQSPFAEWSPILPSNPYSASKAAQEDLCTAYWRTYGVPVVIVNCMNMFGERQDPEKFVPKVLRSVLTDQEVTVHGTAGNIGTRHWLHARNLADGVVYLLKQGHPAMFPAHGPGPRGHEYLLADRPDRYNIASPDRIDNLALAQLIAQAAGRPLRYQLEDFHATRPGHDPHYGLDPAKITQLGWRPPVDFAESLARTVQWSIKNKDWLEE